jgi:hypothetical protein
VAIGAVRGHVAMPVQVSDGRGLTVSSAMKLVSMSEKQRRGVEGK